MLRRALHVSIAITVLAGCGAQMSASMPSAVPRALSRLPATPSTATSGSSTVLVIAEQGLTAESGSIEIYKAPFNGPPQRKAMKNVMGVVIAPDGALIVAAQLDGILVYDPPYKGKPRRIFREFYPSGMLLFDSKGRLFDVDYGSLVYVFDPPYRSKPALVIGGAFSELGSSALDRKDDLFLTDGSGSIHECRSPKYGCKPLRRGFPVAVDRADNDLYAGLEDNILAEFAPGYHKAPIAKVALPFAPAAVRASDAGPVFVAGSDASGAGRLAILRGSLKGHVTQLSMESYFRQNLQFWVAKNRDLFISDGTSSHPCVAIHPYPYTKAPHRCIATKYPIQAIFAR